MDRTRLGQSMMAVGVVLVIVGGVLLASGGDDTSDQRSVVAPITTSAAPATVSPSSASASTTTTSITSTTSTTTTTVPAESPQEFLTELNLAFESADSDFLLNRLNEAVIERYGADQCATYLAGILPQSQGLSMHREVGVSSWGYSTDDVVTSLNEVTAIEVDRVVKGETRINELHWQLVDGVFTWFTDCGTPVVID